MLNQGRFWTRCVRRLLQDIINPTVILCTPKLASFSFPSPPSLLSSLPLPASPSLSVPPCFLSHIHSCLHCFPDRANGDRSSLLPPPLQVVMQVSPLTSPPPPQHLSPSQRWQATDPIKPGLSETFGTMGQTCARSSGQAQRWAWRRGRPRELRALGVGWGGDRAIESR